MLDVLTPCLREKKKKKRRPVFILRERESAGKREMEQKQREELVFVQTVERRRNVEE